MESRDSADVCRSTVEPAGFISDSLGRKSQTLHHEISGARPCRDRRMRSLPRRWTSPCAKVPKTVLGRLRSRETARSATCGGVRRRVGKSVKQEPQQQRAMIQEPIATPPQPSSSSHEDPMQVDKRLAVQESQKMMSALISELCERDVPEDDWVKLGDNNRLCV